MRPGLLLGTALAAPVVAICAAPASAQEVRVEIVATGQAEAAVRVVSASASFYERGETLADADAKRDAKYAEIDRVVARLGLPASAVKRSETNVVVVQSMVPIPPAPPAPPPPPRPAPSSGTSSVSVAVPAPPKPTSVAPSGPGMRTASGLVTIEAASVQQLRALRTELSKIDIVLGNDQVTLANEDEAQRAAKLKALANARIDAEAYARALGLRVVGVASISEAGKLIPPGMAKEIERSIPPGRSRFGVPTAESDRTRVSATIIVEFTLAK